MKRALYIGGFCMPDGNAAAQRVLGIAKILRLNNYDVKFCGLSRALKESKEEGSFDGFKYVNYQYPNSIKSWIEYLSGRDFSICEIKDYNPDLVILYNHPAYAIEYIAKYCNSNNVKVIADVTEWYEASGNIVFKHIKKLDIKRRMQKSHFKLDGLICISTYLSNFYRGKGRPVIEIPPTVDINDSKWHQELEDTDDVTRIIYAGSPGANKDRLDFILKAMDEIVPMLSVPIRFDIIGITAEQYREKWNDDNLRSYVTFHGRRPHSEVIKLLLNADFQIFLRPDILPNRAGFPTKFVETVSSRTLPITNLNSNLKDYIEDSYNGFIIQSIDIVSIKDTLSSALKLNRKQIESLKNNLDTSIFDYHKYSPLISGFLKCVL